MSAAGVQSVGTLALRRPSRTRRRVRAVLRTSAWLVIGVAGLAGVALLLFLHRGDAEGSARVANREIDALLQAGEQIEGRVGVQQRQWYDLFRVTHGVLAATDRRLIYIGVRPEELLPREPEPVELDQWLIPFDRGISAWRGQAFFGTLPGVTVRSGEREESFGIAERDHTRLAAVLAVASGRQSELRAAAAAERQAVEAAAAASRRAVSHLVQLGEGLEEIARRYGTTADSLRRWNALPSDHITAGRRLVVKQER